MIPILYKKSDTNYARNGAGFLVDIISCTVTEERNGAFECSFTYPVTGQHYSQIAEGDTIKAKPNETSDLQLFRIYSHSKPLNGVVTYNAEHISYDANGLPLVALISQGTTAAAAINKAIRDAAFESNFTAWSDISALNNISLTEPCSLRAALGGRDGSILDVWGGEYEFDNYAIKLHAHRGADNGVSIEYGKNLTDITQETNITETYTHLLPYAVYDEEIAGTDETREVVVTLTEKVLAFPVAENIGHQKAYIADLSDMFGDNEAVTESALRRKAAEYITGHTSLGVPKVNINVSFVALWQTAEYKDIAPLERVRLCDTVTVRFAKLGISAKAKVIKTVYDVVKERYASVELGEARSSFADTLLEQAEAVEELSRTVRKGFADATESMKKAIADATAAITGNSGGYVVLHPAEHPQEILIMDAPDIDDALRVWRWNSSGLGYSSTGYDGTYGTAITMNGAIVADYITAGTLNGALLKADSVEANAISAGFKQSITDALNGLHSTVTQEFKTADGELSSSITTSYTNDIAASENRSRSLIQQTASGIMLQVYTKNETSTAISNAVNDANDYTDTQLSGYYTKSETNSQISASANNIMLQVYTKSETSTAIGNAVDNAVDDANDYTDTQLSGYYTKSETNSQISASANNIMLQVYTKSETNNAIGNAVDNAVDDANDYTDTQFGNAVNNANDYTDTQLSGYYTKSETNSQISASANNIMLQVYTKGETSTAIGNAVDDANDYTDTQLSGYYTKSETDNQIAVSENGIRSTVSSAQSKYDITGYTINYYGFGTPSGNGYPAAGNSGKKYLDQSTGKLYTSNGSSWSVSTTLELITSKLQSQITQNASEISSKVSSGDVVSEINQSADTITLTAGRLRITSGNFQIDSNDNVTISEGTLRGGNIMSTNYASSGGSITAGTIFNLSTGYIDSVNFHIYADGEAYFANVVRAGVQLRAPSVYGTTVSGGTMNCTGNATIGGDATISGDILLSNEKVITRKSGNNNYVIAGWQTGRGVLIGNSISSLWLRGENIYANGSPVSTSSDRRQKEDITPLANKYVDMLKAISPVSFKYDSELSHSGRKHTGFIAQDVLQAMTAAGIDTSEFAAFVDVYGDETEYALRYEEFISPLLAYVQQLETRITALENALDNREGYNADDNANQT